MSSSTVALAIESADVSAGTGLATIAAGGPAPVGLRAATSKLCPRLLASPMTMTSAAEAPPGTVVHSVNGSDPA